MQKMRSLGPCWAHFVHFTADIVYLPTGNDVDCFLVCLFAGTDPTSKLSKIEMHQKSYSYVRFFRWQRANGLASIPICHCTRGLARSLQGADLTP